MPESRPVVYVTPPPVDHSALMVFAADGTLRGVELDGQFYAATRRKRTVLYRAGDTVVTLVKTG